MIDEAQAPKLSDARVAELRAQTGRRCGSCSLCCRLLDVPEAGKQPAQWCPHCRPGKGGCSIYQDRPPSCRSYVCNWLVNSDFGDEWFPQRCGIVVDTSWAKESGSVIARFHVDPRTPNRWREEPYYSTIKRVAMGGLRDSSYMTIVSIPPKPWLLVLPHKEVEYGPGVMLPFGSDHFEFVPCKDKDSVLKLDILLRSMHAEAVKSHQDHPDMPLAQRLDYVAQKLMNDPRFKGEKT